MKYMLKVEANYPGGCYPGCTVWVSLYLYVDRPYPHEVGFIETVNEEGKFVHDERDLAKTCMGHEPLVQWVRELAQKGSKELKTAREIDIPEDVLPVMQDAEWGEYILYGDGSREYRPLDELDVETEFTHPRPGTTCNVTFLHRHGYQVQRGAFRRLFDDAHYKVDKRMHESERTSLLELFPREERNMTLVDAARKFRELAH